MIIDCVSDLHGFFPELEGGDLLIVAGDLTATHEPWEYDAFVSWIMKQQYKEKIVIAGNHDNYLQGLETDEPICKHFTYLCDSGTEFEGLKIWGSPWTKTFKGMNPRCKAFTCDTEEELEEKWKLIPNDTDILITHGPPHGCWLDQDRKGNMLGSISLRDRIWNLKIKLHVFGHIHEGYGFHPYISPDVVNASIVNERYEHVNNPVRVIL